MEHVERQYIVMKLMLVLMRDRKARQGQVKSVGYIREYKEMPDEIGVYSLGQMSNEELLSLVNELNIKLHPPANGRYDLYMNDLGYKLISSGDLGAFSIQASYSQLINLVKDSSPAQIELVSQVVEAEKQKQSNIGLDQLLQASVGAERYEAGKLIWSQLLTDLWCNGASDQRTPFPITYVLMFSDALNMNTWDIIEPSRYIEMIWPNIQIKCGEQDHVQLSLHNS